MPRASWRGDLTLAGWCVEAQASGGTDVRQLSARWKGVTARYDVARAALSLSLAWRIDGRTTLITGLGDEGTLMRPDGPTPTGRRAFVRMTRSVRLGGGGHR